MTINKVTSQETTKNPGWIVTTAGTAALLALGVLYAWSVFKANIPAEWGWADSQKSLPYSVACVVFSIMTMVGARLLGKYGPRVVVTIGGILAGVGVILIQFIHLPLDIYIHLRGSSGFRYWFCVRFCQPGSFEMVSLHQKLA